MNGIIATLGSDFLAYPMDSSDASVVFVSKKSLVDGLSCLIGFLQNCETRVINMMCF